MAIVSWSEFQEGKQRQPQLVPGQIHVWQASVASSSAIPSVLDRVLSEDERARANRFHFQRDRASYVVCRGLLRHLLAAYTGIEPAQIQFQYGEKGKPAIGNHGYAKLQFNVSQSGEAVLLGFAVDLPVGVDVERMQDRVDFAGVARTSFSETERNAVLACPPEQRARLFYEYWTCKESCIKADGRGLSLALDQFSILQSNRGPQWREVGQAHPGVFAEAMGIRIIETLQGYAAAIAAAQTGWDVVEMKLGEVATS
jgi:4'-phosphopantetheinyl transferase